uniref:ZP domain-containing protein n=1 Tax=Oncorhynchus kisutch TaxID=8019 RepID=A0A8C7LE44_ONCKI
HGSSSDNARLTTSNADTRHHTVSNSLILAMALTQGKSIVVVSFTGSVVTSCEACHPHATCLASLLNNEVEVESSSFKLVTCNCKPGFVGNGITCYDLKLCAGGSCCRQGYSWSTELGCVDNDLHSSPGDSRSVQFQCGGRQCPVGEDCISVGGTSLCADPCQHYTVLNDDWRSTNNTELVYYYCDQRINWQGWYRLFLGDTSVQMPERCVEKYMCGTAAPMWLTEPHPQLLDGVVQRGVCGHWFSECCHFRENPIHVKACYGNYYVYQFVPTTICNLAYCAGIVQCSDDKINWRCERKGESLELVCGRNFIQVGLQMVHLEAGRLDASSGHLADPSCSAHQEANGTVWYQVERREGRCGNTLETNSTHAVYSNSLFVYPLNSRNVSLSQPLSIPFSCAYPLETESSLDVAIKPYLLDHHQVRVEESGSSLRARFSALLFLYQGDYRDVFLHCRLSLCDQRSSSFRRRTADVSK